MSEEEQKKSYGAVIGLVLGLVGLAIVVLSGVLWVRSFGLPPQIAELIGPGLAFDVSLSPAEAEAEIARLGALQGETLPAPLSAIAAARVDCTVALMLDKPNQTAREAAQRYFLVLFAARQQESSPLVDSRLRAFAVKGAEDFGDLTRLVQQGVISESRLKQLTAATEGYMSETHPLYSGIDLVGVSWAFSDFQRIVTMSGVNSGQIGKCFRSRIAG